MCGIVTIEKDLYRIHTAHMRLPNGFLDGKSILLNSANIQIVIACNWEVLKDMGVFGTCIIGHGCTTHIRSTRLLHDALQLALDTHLWRYLGCWLRRRLLCGLCRWCWLLALPLRCYTDNDSQNQDNCGK